MAVVIRKKFGGFDRVKRVFAYDPADGVVLAMFEEFGGRAYLEGVPTGDLEAMRDDPQGTFVDLDTALRERAGFFLRHADA